MINEDVLQFLVDGLQKDAIVYIQSDNEVTFDHLRNVFFSPLGTKHFRCVEPQRHIKLPAAVVQRRW